VVKHPVILFVFPHHHFCWQNHNLGWWKVPSIQHSYGKWPMSRWFSTWWFTSKSQIILNHYQPPTHTKIRANLYWLVVDLPLWKICSSVGMIIPNIWKVIKNDPNHQPALDPLTSYHVIIIVAAGWLNPHDTSLASWLPPFRWAGRPPSP